MQPGDGKELLSAGSPLESALILPETSLTLYHQYFPRVLNMIKRGVSQSLTYV